MTIFCYLLTSTFHIYEKYIEIRNPSKILVQTVMGIFLQPSPILVLHLQRKYQGLSVLSYMAIQLGHNFVARITLYLFLPALDTIIFFQIAAVSHEPFPCGYNLNYLV